MSLAVSAGAVICTGYSKPTLTSGGGHVHKRFTDQARRAVVLAQQEARAGSRDRVGTEHIPLGLIEAGGVAAAALESAGLSLDAVRRQAGRMSGRHPL